MHRDTSEQVWSKYAIVFHHQLFAQEEKIKKLVFGRINSPCPFTLSITDVLWGCLYSLNAISVSPNTSHVPPRGMHCSGAMTPCCCCWKFAAGMYKASPAHVQEQQVDRRTISRISFVHLSNELTLAQHWASLQKVSAEVPRLSKTQTEIKHGYPTITGWPTAARPWVSPHAVPLLVILFLARPAALGIAARGQHCTEPNQVTSLWQCSQDC